MGNLVYLDMTLPAVDFAVGRRELLLLINMKGLERAGFFKLHKAGISVAGKTAISVGCNTGQSNTEG